MAANPLKLRQVLALIPFLLASPHSWAAAGRVMSINACADSLVLALVPKDRITSISWLAREPEIAPEWRAALNVPINHGTAEEVLAQRPDLVIAGAFTTQATRNLLARLHLRMLVVPPAEDFAAIRDVTRAVAAAVGNPAGGEAMIARMDATLQELERSRPSHPPAVLAWDGGTSFARGGMVLDSILRSAGGRNAGEGMSPTVDLEQIVWRQPDILIQPQPAAADQGARDRRLNHPVLEALPRRIWVSPALYACGTPAAADAAARLRQALIQP